MHTAISYFVTTPHGHRHRQRHSVWRQLKHLLFHFGASFLSVHCNEFLGMEGNRKPPACRLFNLRRQRSCVFRYPSLFLVFVSDIVWLSDGDINPFLELTFHTILPHTLGTPQPRTCQFNAQDSNKYGHGMDMSQTRRKSLIKKTI